MASRDQALEALRLAIKAHLEAQIRLGRSVEDAGFLTGDRMLRAYPSETADALFTYDGGAYGYYSHNADEINFAEANRKLVEDLARGLGFDAQIKNGFSMAFYWRGQTGTSKPKKQAAEYLPGVYYTVEAYYRGVEKHVLGENVRGMKRAIGQTVEEGERLTYKVIQEGFTPRQVSEYKHKLPPPYEDPMRTFRDSKGRARGSGRKRGIFD
jgi:hypothetical protein